MTRTLLERNRWLVVIGAIMIQVALGAIYAWSVFTADLTDPRGPYAFTATETAWIFSLGLATFATVMVVAGKLLPILGPRVLSIASGIVLGAGYILGGLWGHTFDVQLMLIGILGGAGIGLGYVVPIAVGIKWFPDKKGLITGLGVAGFGFGATIWVKLAGSWLNLLSELSLFGLPGVQSTFIVYGIAFTALVLIGSIFMVNPRADWSPDGSVTTDAKRASIEVVSMTPREMLATPQFYGVWLVFLFSALAGLMVIYSIKLFGIDTLEWNGVESGHAAAIAGTAMAWYAIFNGLGRIVWGFMSDRIGRTWSIGLMVAFQGITVLSTYHIFVVMGTDVGLVVAASLIGFNFGGNFALMPAWTADLFGNKHVGSNYPWVFTAYGVAGICGPLLAGYFKDMAADGPTYVSWLYENASPSLYPAIEWLGPRLHGPIAWMAPFLIAGVLCLVAVIIPLVTKKPAPRAVPARGAPMLERA